MTTVTFRALSFLQAKLAARGIEYRGADIKLGEGATVADLVAACRLEDHEVEAVFVNHKGVPPDHPLHDGDCVVLIPPGTPGPHRYLLGIAKLPAEPTE